MSSFSSHLVVESGAADQEHSLDSDSGRNQENNVRFKAKFRDRTCMFASLIAVIGVGISAAFIGFGVKSANDDQTLRFENQASVLITAIENTWKDYEMTGLFIHEACRTNGHDHGTDELPDESYRICSWEEFDDLYKYVSAGGLEFEMVGFAPNVTHAFRAELERDAAAYYQEFYPDLPYYGFTGFEPDPTSERGVSIQVRSQQPFYFPQHLVQPVRGNEFWVDLDLYSSQYNFLIDDAVTAFEPKISNPIPSRTGDKTILFVHPGVQLDVTQERASGLASAIVSFSAFIERAAVGLNERLSVFIYDTSARVDPSHPKIHYFGGVHLRRGNDGIIEATYEPELDIESLRKSSRIFEEDIKITSQTWTVIVKAQSGTYEPDYVLALVGGVVIAVACCCLALWFHSKTRRAAKIAEITNKAKSEKAALIVESARNAARAERDLNEFLAHEVRNPLSAAITACSFLKSAHPEQEQKPLITANKEETEVTHQESIREDIDVISYSLEFINDLLRSMLDWHKMESNQLKLELKHTDVLKDIYEPVKNIIYRRGSSFDMLVECPDNLVVMVDGMRLKQIVLNLANNSKKFVEKGFIRLRAEVVDGLVQISVEDSGRGIPKEKRSMLFARFQESLDSMNQGTGVGLSLCKKLVELMDGEISLDESFDSGVEGFPGTRFVISLKIPPIQVETIDLDLHDPDRSARSPQTGNGPESARDMTLNSSTRSVHVQRELPEKLSVLIVDDDLVIRKLLSRSIRRVAPGWSIQEAANGETALSLVDSKKFDLILMDQYMASVEKQLLGTETVHALRAKGVACRIIGLSANDIEEEFLKAGADYFSLKPLPCEKEALELTLLGALYGEEEADVEFAGSSMISQSQPASLRDDSHENFHVEQDRENDEEELSNSRTVMPLDLGPSSNGALLAMDVSPSRQTSTSYSLVEKELPEKLSILIVDDVKTLRKLLSRSIRRVAPGWSVQEAANGETALSLVDTETFDLILMDQYMASPEENKMLGTETISALRAKGVTCRICGLSANSLEEEFLDSGADCFFMKPLPSEKEALKLALLRAFYGALEIPSLPTVSQTEN